MGESGPPKRVQSVGIEAASIPEDERDHEVSGDGPPGSQAGPRAIPHPFDGPRDSAREAGGGIGVSGR